MDSCHGISSQLRARRRKIGLSLSQLARRAGTSAPTLSRYENGWTRFELNTLRKLATALECRLVVRLEPRSKEARAPRAGEVVSRLRRLFWDQRLTTDLLRDYSLWVVERVVELGNLEDVHTLVRFLGREVFLDLVSRARLSSDKTRSFWLAILEREGMECTRKYSRAEASSSWLHSGSSIPRP